MKVLYEGPDGEEVNDPTAQFIVDKIRHAGSGYWHMESNMAGLAFQGAGQNAGAQLMLMVEQPYGVLLRYCTPSGADEFVLTSPLGDSSKMVSIYPGGDEWIVPSTYFVSPERALTVIEAFVADGYRRDGPWVVLGTE